MRVFVIIQARMGSSRLPGKVLMPLGRDTISVLGHVIKRVQMAETVDYIIIATTTLDQDDLIVKEAHKYGVSCFCGDENDVLGRYYHAAADAGAQDEDIIVRITSDCPLYDPDILDRMIKQYQSWGKTDENIDYYSNVMQRTLPRGLDTEIFNFRILKAVHNITSDPFDREHVTWYIRQHPEEFSVKHYEHTENLSHHRWTLDTPEDYEMIKKIYDGLYESGKMFKTKKIIQFLEQNPDIFSINQNVEQKAG